MTAKTILMIDDGNWNGVTSIQINTINCFLDKGHLIKFILFDNGIKKDEVKFSRWPQNKNIEYIIIQYHDLLSKLCNKNRYLDLLYKYNKCKDVLNKYKSAYCFEFKAGLICRLNKRIHKEFKYVINSIELYENTKGDKGVSAAFNEAQYIVTQDEVRKAQLIELYKISDTEKILISYNSNRKSDKIETTQLQFPGQFMAKRKLLFIGSLIEGHCFDKLLDSIPLLREDVVLIIHGWGIGELKFKLNHLISKYPEKVWLSDFKLTETTKFQLYNSVDIGFVTFASNNYNTKYAGLSAGKLFDFMRVGKPVLVSDIDGLNKFVEDNCIGVVLDNWNNLNNKIEELLSNMEKYSLNSFSHYDEFEFDRKFEHIYKIIA